jgi:exonuclease SbcC
MIITSIKAENVLKYEALSLPDLPEKGVIAISGKNESGKSTIGETVCFALFGRTFSLSENELDKMVHWGSGGCSVSMTFRVGSSDHYRIERFLDKEGTHSAKFSRLGEEDLPIARGVEGVADALFMVLGYDYDEFVDSFYLAQREIKAPQPNSHTVKAMAGIAALEFVNEQFDEEIAEQEDVVTMSRFRSDEIDAEFDELAIKDGHLKALEDELGLVRSAEAENNDKIEQLKVDVAAYRDTLPDIQAARNSIGRNKMARFFFLLLAVIAGGIWGALTQQPDHQLSQQLLEQITTHLPNWNEQHLQGTMYLAAVMGVLFLFVQIRLWSLRSRLKDLMLVAERSAETIKAAHQRNVVLGDSLLDRDEDETDAEAIETGLEPNEFSEMLDQVEAESPDNEQQTETVENTEENNVIRPNDEEINRISSRVANASINGSNVDEVTDQEINWTRNEVSRLQILATNLDRAIYDEEQRLKHAGRLNDEKQSLAEKILHSEARISTRALANELLAGANKHMSTQFNNDVRDLVSRTLPLFTEGRYEHLQIDENMEVSVFSGEKRDFMDLEEVSSGTQRQIMLALRLALSQELVNRSVEGEQFVFLDEPFAFFDEARTINSLKVLPNLSDEINQIFVVAQEFPADNMTDFEQHIECFREVETI